jgi:hypothetical protein
VVSSAPPPPRTRSVIVGGARVVAGSADGRSFWERDVSAFLAEDDSVIFIGVDWSDYPVLLHDNDDFQREMMMLFN